MRSNVRLPLCIALMLMLATSWIATAQSTAHAARHPATAGVLLISDIHFDPFQDPDKVAALAKTPITGWSRILNSPASTNQAAEFARVREKCGKDVYDSSAPLLASSLKAVASHRRSIKFGVLTGDLIAHEFDCRFETTLPGHTHAESQRFLEETIQYIVDSLHHALRKPLYVTLGNNDTACIDYRLDPHDPLFAAVRRSVLRAAGLADSGEARDSFDTYGSFTAVLPAPLKNTRLVAFDDLPLSARFLNCAGSKDDRRGDASLQWLRQQLKTARDWGERVWFAAHIPPGIDPGSTLFSKNACKTAAEPTMMLSSDGLATTLAEYADTVKLALFAHTHMDELRLIRGGTAGSGGGDVPVKMIASISPVRQNNPSFLIAQVDAKTAVMRDYTQFAVASPTGEGAWTKQYSFDAAYGVDSFTAPVLHTLIEGFRADPAGAAAASREYMNRHSTGSPLYRVAPVWSEFSCLLTTPTAQEYLQCACPAKLTTTSPAKQ